MSASLSLTEQQQKMKLNQMLMKVLVDITKRNMSIINSEAATQRYS